MAGFAAQARSQGRFVPYVAPRWLPGGHLQTLYAALFAPRPRVAYRRERWDTPDGDFVDVDVVNADRTSGERTEGNPGFPRYARTVASGNRAAGERTEGNLGFPPLPPILKADREAPLVVLFHGLEGKSSSHYAHALMAAVRARGWRGAVIHFRGCSGEANRLPRAYHSGDTAELDWIVQRLRETHSGTLYLVGVSLGGNVLLKWLGEHAADAARAVTAAAAISAPMDVMACGNALDRGFNLIYTRAFLATLRKKSLAKLERFPDLYDAKRVRAARTLRAFDDLVTAPLHGFNGTDDYWTRASSKPSLARITVPTLVLNARNDPFLPPQALPTAGEVSSSVLLDFPQEGGHVGFVSGPYPGHLEWLPRRIIEFFEHRH